MAFTGNVAQYVSSVKFGLLAAKANTTAYVAGNLRTSGAANLERVYVCVIAGTSGTNVTLTATRGAITADGSATWQEASGWPALNGDSTNTATWNNVKNTAVTLGMVIMNNAKTQIMICSVAGTAGNGAEPSFSGSVGGTVADNTVTWRTISLALGSSWGAPFKSIQGYFGTSLNDPATSVFVGSDHNYAMTAGTWNGSNAATVVKIMSVGYSNVPPIGSDYAAGALESTNVAATDQLSFSSANFSFFGITFKSTSNTAGTPFTIGGDANGFAYWENCSIQCLGVTVGDGIALGNVELNNTTFKFGATNQSITSVSGTFALWRDTASAIDGTGSLPTNLFNMNVSGATLNVRGVDLSAVTGNIWGTSNNQISATFENCRINASATLVAGNPSADGRVRFIRCSNTTNRGFSEVWDRWGKYTTKTDVLRTGGASVSGQLVSWFLTTTSFASYGVPFPTLPIQINNNTTGANVNVNMYGISNSAAMPTNADLYINSAYFNSGSNTQGAASNSRSVNPLSSTASLTADTSAWDSAVTARQNTHAYVTGDIIKVASNPGRVFFCTSGGTSAGSEPVGYASAVDGGVVTDSGATFRAGWRFTLLAAMTPQLTGPICTIVKLAKPSTSLYIDPFIVLS